MNMKKKSLQGIEDFYLGLGYKGTKFRTALARDKDYQEILKEKKQKLTKQFKVSAAEKRKYVLATDVDFEILAKCKQLEQSKSGADAKALARLIKAQLEDDWRPPLVKTLNQFLKKPESLDPLGHVKLAVGDLDRSKEFYGKLFGELGYKKVAEKAWVTRDGFGIWLGTAKLSEPKYKFSAPGLHHLCFKAESVKQVDEIYKFLLQEKTFIFDPPEHYPEYTKNYYAVFFADPDGIKLEIAYY